MSIRVVARDHVKPECTEEALKLIKEMVEITRTEKGNIAYTFNQDLKDPEFFAMIEEWECEECLQTHMESEHFKRIIPQLGAMMAEPSRLEVYKQIV